ncbi:hypothetical protein [Vallitalea guaymasensis]|uniref:hypothetical protein n=1 Tax=Vallitalea guaymasensis TaxID=1185412 RepID=UPI00187D5450|nr:hypothetical protein [Vallitalea guaymasensis]
MIEFIEEFRVANTSTICELFYPSLRVAQIRLKKMTELQELKRHRYYYTNEYIYYKKRNNQLRHDLILTNFYRELNRISKVIRFDKEFDKIKGIRPDGFIVYSVNGLNYIAFVEVEISKKGLDLEKYKRLYLGCEYKEHLPVFPLIIIITNNKIKEKIPFGIISLKTDLSDIAKIIS